MRAFYLALFSFFIILNSCSSAVANKDEKKPIITDESVTIDSTKLLRHVVLFNFNETATKDMIKKIEQEFAGLQDKISEIHSFEWGTNNSPEGLDKGFTHCFLVTFLTEEGREKYLPHPDHQAFVKLIGPYIEDVTVIDYWTE